MDECCEVACGMSIEGIYSFSDAANRVTEQMGPPSEIGYQIHDNVAEYLYVRAMRHVLSHLA